MKRFSVAAVLLASAVFTLTVAAQQGAQAPAPTPAAAVAAADFVPVTDRMLQNPDPADWLMWRRTLNHWGYSPLNQITRNNVRTLSLAWSRGLSTGLQEGTPLVYRGTMYFPNPLDVVQSTAASCRKT